MSLSARVHGPQVPLIVAGVLGLGTTLAVTLIPGLRFAYESLELHVALESAQGVVALVLCYLMSGRLRETLRLRDLLLTMAFASFASTNLFVSALPIALGGENIGFTTWTAAGLRLVAAATLAAAAVAPDRTLSRPTLVHRTAFAAVATVAVVLALAALADSSLSELIDPTLSPDASREPLISGHPVAVTVQLLSTILMSVAAAAFTATAARTGDDLLRWLAAGATLGAFARVNYVLFPSLYTEWFYTGDLLRFGSYLLFLVGAAREIRAYWRGHAEMAVLEERRRMAREIHDGLTQELSFMRSQLSPLAGGVRPEMVPHLSAAADRALMESRRAIAALGGSRDGGSLADGLVRAAEEVATREHVAVAFEAGPDVPADCDAQPELERIVREAVTNAIRHGGASSVTIRLHLVDAGLAVQVRDDGRGFELGHAGSAPGFGLRSMRQRAEALGGRLRVESSPEHGTCVEAVVPVQRGQAARQSGVSTARGSRSDA